MDSVRTSTDSPTNPVPTNAPVGQPTIPPAYQLDLRNPFIAGFLAILLPGLGHAYQKRWGKAILFFVLISILFWTGIALGTMRSIYYRMDDKEWRLEVFAQVFAGAWSWPALLPVSDFREWEMGIDQLHRERGRNMELARLFTLIAGLLNLLVIADAVDGPAYRRDELEYERQLAGGSAPSGSDPPNNPANSQASSVQAGA